MGTRSIQKKKIAGIKQNSIAICHVNVRNLLDPTRMTDLEIIISLHNIGVLCVSETWLSYNCAPNSANIQQPLDEGLTKEEELK